MILLLLLSWDNIQFICFISIYSLTHIFAALRGLAAWVVTLLNSSLSDLGAICKRYHDWMISELEPWKLRWFEGQSHHRSDQTPLALPDRLEFHWLRGSMKDVHWFECKLGFKWLRRQMMPSAAAKESRNLLDGAGMGEEKPLLWATHDCTSRGSAL